jgi:hypothetical protein
MPSLDPFHAHRFGTIELVGERIAGFLYRLHDPFADHNGFTGLGLAEVRERVAVQ